MAITFPFSSVPLFFSLSQILFLTSLFAIFKLLIRERSIPNVCSAKASLFPSGLRKTSILFSSQYFKSIFSNPDPGLAINFNFFANVRCFLSRGNLDLIIIPSNWLAFFLKSSRVQFWPLITCQFQLERV